MTKKKQNNRTINENDRQELYLLYQNSTANLAAIKKSQWQVVVFYSAILAFLVTQANNLPVLSKTLISITLPFGARFIWKMVELYQEKMAEERAILSNIYNGIEKWKGFGKPFLECRRPKRDVQAADSFETLFRKGVKLYIIITCIVAVLSFWSEFFVRLFKLICTNT